MEKNLPKYPIWDVMRKFVSLTPYFLGDVVKFVDLNTQFGVID
jgi:hypothetical protein